MQAGPERNPIRNCFGFISSSFARLVDLWTTAARGNLGDYCCQATADLNRCAYAVKMHHVGHASVLMLRSKQEFQPPRLKNRSHDREYETPRDGAVGTHHAVVAVSSVSSLAAMQIFINTASSRVKYCAVFLPDVYSPRPVVHATVIAAM